MANVVYFSGNVGRIETKRFPAKGDGKEQVKTELSLAVRQSGKPKGEDTIWVAVELWGLHAELAEKFVTKGVKFGVSGELQQDTWEKDGETKSKIVVKKVSQIDLPSKSESAAAGGAESEDEVADF